MKYKNYFFVAVAAMAMAACSNDGFDDIYAPNQQGSGGTPSESSGEVGSGDLATFDIDFNTEALSESETVPTSSSDAHYEDFIENFFDETEKAAADTLLKTLQITYSNNGVTCEYYSKKGKLKTSFNSTTTLTDDEETDATVTISGQHVTVTGYKKLHYVLRGSTTDGGFKLYSDKKFKLSLDTLTLSNNSGAAINIQKGPAGEDKRCYLIINGANALSDGSTYSTPDKEDEKGVIFSEGKILVSGKGQLTINGNGKNGIVSDDYVYLHRGPVMMIIPAAGHDGVKANDGIIVGGGVTNISLSGEGAKGLTSDGTIQFIGGRTTVVNSAVAVYDSTDKDFSQPSGVKSDTILVDGGLVQAKSTGKGGKGMRATSLYTINGGEVDVITTGQTVSSGSEDAEAKGIHVGEKSKTTGQIYINGGLTKVRATGGDGSEAVESKNSIAVNAGVLEAYAYDDAVNAAKTITVNGGVVYASSTSNDAIDSNGTLSFTGGVSIAMGTSSNNAEASFDCDQNTFSITGGTLIGLGCSASNPTSASCKQCAFITSLAASAGTRYNVMTSDGTCLASFSAPRGFNNGTLLFSSSKLATGSTYTITSGGTPTISDGGVSCEGAYANGVTVSGSTTQVGSVSQSGTITGSSGMGGGGNQPGGQPGGGGRPGGW